MVSGITISLDPSVLIPSADSCFSKLSPYFDSLKLDSMNLESIENWAKDHPRLAIVAAVAFAALGIGAGVAVVTVVASVTHAAIMGLASLVCLFACATIGYFLVRQAISTFHPSGIEDVQGSPPNIALSDVAGQKNYRIQVMNDTLNHLKAGFYTSPNGTRHPLDLNATVQNTSLLLNAGPVNQRPGNEPTRIIVKDMDCLYAAAELHARGLSPLVLDMASDRHFGGGYLNGARAQEEECCRRTGLCLAVDTQHGLQRQNFYPLHRNSAAAGIYVPRVPVFRAGYEKGYQYLNHPFEISFGVFAAYHNPQLDRSTGSPRLHPTTAAATREKIRTFFEMARQHGHQSVVFSALGCGAFGNPPDQIAEITLDVIQREFAHCFKEIVIAIVEDHNTGQPHNPEGNFKPFARRTLACGGKVFDSSGRELTVIT